LFNQSIKPNQNKNNKTVTMNLRNLLTGCCLLFAQFANAQSSGTSVNLTGANYVNLSSSAAELCISYPATVEFWMKNTSNHLTNVTSNAQIIYAMTDGNNVASAPFPGDNVYVGFGRSSGAPGFNNILLNTGVISSGDAYTCGIQYATNVQNQWHHYAVTYNGLTNTIFIDGVFTSIITSA
jgi:hypothetical protein